MDRILPYFLILAALAALVLATPIAAQGTEPAQVTILQVVPHADPDDQQLGLDIYFTLRRSDGGPVTRNEANLDDSGEVRLIGVNQEPSAATIEPATEPIRIAMVIDTSGSMRPSIEEVRKAARNAIGHAPPNALVAVYPFNRLGATEVLVPLQDYTANHELAARAVDQITIEPAPARPPTCLYNAAIAATTQLAQSAAPGERRAVILFTDGREDNGNGAPCGERTAEDVINNANDRNTLIYTIGLCGTDCSNLDATTLDQIANKTKAFANYGGLDTIDAIFSTVMEQVNSQWLARVHVLAQTGENRASLTIFRDETLVPITGNFVFVSPRDFSAVPTFKVRARYRNEQDDYEISINGESTHSVQQVVIEAWSENSQIAELRVALEDLAGPISFPTTKLTTGNRYNFRVRATDADGRFFTATTPILPEDPEVLAQTGDLSEYRPSFSYSIEPLRVDWTNGKLLIKLNIENALETSPPIFSGSVSESGREVLTFERKVPDLEGRIEVSLEGERRFREAANQGKTLTLVMKPENKPSSVSQERDFVPEPPPTNYNIWAIGILIALLICLVVLGLIKWKKPRTRCKPRSSGNIYDPPSTPIRPPPDPAPPQESKATLPVMKNLEVALIRSPTSSRQQERRWLVDEATAIIGRGSKNKVDINDPGVSATHLQISRGAGRSSWVMTACQTTNGTKVGIPDASGQISPERWQEMSPFAQRPIETGMRVMLGQETEIEFQII